MKHRIFTWAAAFCLAATLRAEIPSAEKLLPADALFVLSAPDGTKLRESFTHSAQGQLWNDAAMKPFRDNFVKNFNADVLEPMEKSLGFKLSDYYELAQGQITFALTQNGWQGKPDDTFGWVFLVDAGNKSDALKTNLAALKKKWQESAKELKTEKIRDIEFTTLVTSDEELNKGLGKVSPKGEQAESKPKKIEITVGQSGSLFISANSPKVIEAILTHQSGGSAPALSDNAVFEANRNLLFRDARAFAWLNMKPILEAAQKAPASADGPKPEKMLSALGLNGLKSAAITYSDSPEGAVLKGFVGAPETERKGVFKLLTPERKDSNPPPFIPADAVKFSRWRLDVAKAFNSLETMMGEISPMSTGLFKLVLDNAGKDQDPNFDLRKELVANLGNDVITYEKSPRGQTAQDLSSPPGITLISSPNAERCAAALKVGISSISPEFKEREFLGRKIYTFPLPNLNGSKGPMKTLHFSASAGYVGFSSDVAMLEEFLRSSEAKGKTLAETAGLGEAAQIVGGMGTGLFGFENQREKARAGFDALKKDPSSVTELLGAPNLPGKAVTDENKNLTKWADFSLLPPFDSVSKYFHFTVYSGNFDANGFTFTLFAPTPPQLKK